MGLEFGKVGQVMSIHNMLYLCTWGGGGGGVLIGMCPQEKSYSFEAGHRQLRVWAFGMLRKQDASGLQG